MGTTLNSINTLLASATNNGLWRRYFFTQFAAPDVVATTSSGYTTMMRGRDSITFPSSFGAGITGAYLVYFRGAPNQLQGVVCALEYVLGTLTVSGNSFAAGVSMPVKNIQGGSVQTAAALSAIYVSTAASISSGVITVTYTNQDGTAGRTLTITPPTSTPGANNAWLMAPHLQSGDTGIRAVTNMSISAGSSGVFKAVGLLPLGWSIGTTVGSTFSDPMAIPSAMFPINASEVLAFYTFMGASSAVDVPMVLAAVAEN